MTIVTDGEILSFMDEAGSDHEEIIISVKGAVEDLVSTHCRRTFESTSYSNERYSGNGFKIINLNQYPCTAIDRVSIGVRNAIEITNTSSGSWATAGVSSTGLRLVLNGTADETVLFSTYSTIATVVAAVNALGNGWSATISSSDYSSFLSTDLVTQAAKSCIDSSIVYLTIPNISESAIEFDNDRGQIFSPTGFPRGFRNIFVSYTAGYSSSNMPEDLKLAVKIITQYIYEKAEQNLLGIDLFNIGSSGSTGLRTVFEKGFILPREAEMILGLYKRTLVGAGYG